MNIAHTLNDHETGCFMRLLAKSYEDFDFSPYLCRLAVVEFDGKKYIGASDARQFLFLPAPDELPLGDYEGLPHMVKCEKDLLSRNANGLMAQLAEFPEYTIDIDPEIDDHSAELSGEPAMMAKLCSNNIRLQVTKDFDAMFSANKFHFLYDAVGWFDKARYAMPTAMIGFMNTASRGFAILMPMNPEFASEINFKY